VRPEAWDLALRLAIALLLGAAIGLERQWHQKMAGLRTNALVALGSGGFVVYGALLGAPLDLHVAAQVVTGVGFLGAGVILRQGLNVHGLNTAATLWCAAMVGTLAGGGLILAALVAAAFVVLTNYAMRPLVLRLNERVARLEGGLTTYTLELVSDSSQAAEVRKLAMRALRAADLTPHEIQSEGVAGTDRTRVSASGYCNRRSDDAVEAEVGRLTSETAVHSAAWTVERPEPEP
jgi:putative Mg2+ transporter-C (MgtC) family protein